MTRHSNSMVKLMPNVPNTTAEQYWYCHRSSERTVELDYYHSMHSFPSRFEGIDPEQSSRFQGGQLH